MAKTQFEVRRTRPEDMDEVFHVRTSVVQNHLSLAQLRERGITPGALIEQMNAATLGSWSAERDGAVVGFSMAFAHSAEVFALFVLPRFEGEGIGGRLLDEALHWLFELGHSQAVLSTGRGTRAHGFYLARGWVARQGIVEDGEEVTLAMELPHRPCFSQLPAVNGVG